MADPTDEIIDWLMKHKGIKDERAQRILRYLEEHGKLGSLKEAQNHLRSTLKSGGVLEHENTGKLDKNIHNILREGFGLKEKEARAREEADEAVERKAETEEELAEDLEEKEEEESGEREKLAKVRREEIEERMQRDREEAREREKWRRLRGAWGKTKTTAKVVHGAATLGSGWVGFFLFFALIIWFLDSFYGYAGPAEFSFELRDLRNLGAWSAFWIIMIYHIIKNRDSFEIGEWVSYGIAVLTLMFVAFTGTLNWLGVIHLIFIVMLWWIIIKKREDKITSNVMLSALIIIDFYRFVIFKAFLPMTWVIAIMRIPILLIGTIVYLEGKFPEKNLPKVAFWTVVTVIVLLNWQALVLASKTIITTEEGVAVIGPLEVLKGAWGGFENFLADIKKSYESQLEYATGGYYKGKVEENQNAQLGVYIENLEAADKTFYSGEQVVIWGDLKARTLDQPINVSLKCGAKDVQGDVLPKGKYEIERLEDLGFECRINATDLKNGSNTINIIAEFNFKTLAFLKTYMMHRDRIRSLRKDNIDPLTEYGIIDKTPTAVYTNGPIRLGMGTTEPPVGLIDDTSISFIGVTVENQWQGQIKEIKQLEIQIPSIIPMEGGSKLYCRNELEKVGEEEGYTTYRLTEDYLKQIKIPITTYKSWRCTLLNLNPNKVLGNTPVTTYYYRANVEYVYEIGKTINVDVKPQPEVEKTKLTNCAEVCGNNAGCICDINNCKVAKGAEIKLGENCDKETEALV